MVLTERLNHHYLHGRDSSSRYTDRWLQERTGKLLGLGKSTVSRDIKLALGLAKHPQIGKAKNKSHANWLAHISQEATVRLERRLLGTDPKTDADRKVIPLPQAETRTPEYRELRLIFNEILDEHRKGR